MVIHDNLHHRDIIPGCRGNLVHVHAEAAVACNIDNRLIPASHLCAYSGTQAVPHGSQSSRSEKGAGLAVLVVLGRPHLVLSHLSDNDSVPACDLVDGLDDERTCQQVLIIAQRVHILHTLYVGYPLVVVHRVQPGIQLAQDDLHVPDDAGVHLNILVNLCRVNVQLENLCILRKFGRIAGHTVAEPGAHHNQQVGFGYAEVGGFGAVHAHHTRVQLVSPVKGTLSHKTVRYRRLNLMGKCPQLIGRIGQHSAAAHKDKRL